MELQKNEWLPFIVQGVKIGSVKRFYEVKKVNRKIDVPGIGYLYREDISNVDEHYAISLDSEFTNTYTCLLTFDKGVFETLLNSKYTRIVDYFVFARNIVKLYGPGELPNVNEPKYTDKKEYSFSQFIYYDSVTNLSVNLFFWLDLYHG